MYCEAKSLQPSSCGDRREYDFTHWFFVAPELHYSNIKAGWMDIAAAERRCCAIFRFCDWEYSSPK